MPLLRAAMPPSLSVQPLPEVAMRTLRLFVLTALFCVLVAAVLTLADPERDRFGRNLWFSECIGLWVAFCGALVRQLPWVRRRGSRTALLMALGIGIPLGYVLGYTTAYAALGEPIKIIGVADARLAAIGATLLAGGFVSYLTWLRSRLSSEAMARANAQQLAAEAELRMLRAQLDPHMLFNTLANLRALVDDDPASARLMIDRLITWLRGALAASRSDSTTLAAEFAQLAAYLDIMALRLGARLHYTLDLPEALLAVPVPAMLLQPLVENALRHGIEPKIGGSSVQVSARLSAQMLELEVSDTGLGLPPDAPAAPASDTRSGYGLAHVRERLRALYGDRASLQLARQQPTGTRAIVRIPT